MRDLREERRVSMEVFADALATRLAARAELDVVQPTVRVGRSRRLARFAQYPFAAASVRADVHHIVDHAYADVTRFLPKERALVTCHDLITLVATERDVGFMPRRSALARFRWSVSFLRRAAVVACVSEATRADVLRLIGVPEEQVHVVPQGCGPEFTRLPEDEVARVRAELGGEAIVLHVGGVQPYKNVGAVRDVVAALRRDGVDARLVRAGGPDLVPLWRLVELYSACDVFVFPSHYEGFGLPVLEAMACGAPVVVSEAPALTELVGDAGVVAQPTRLVDEVKNVLESRELTAVLRKRGIERAAAYTWERTVGRYLELYASVAGRPA